VAQRAVEVKALPGQARNPTHGETGRESPLPWRVFNLVPDRIGGYTPFGRRTRLLVDPANPGTSLPVTLSNIRRLIGADETGISSFKTADGVAGDLQLFRGRVTANRSTPIAFTAGTVPALVHLDAAGAYVSRNNYFVFDQTHPDRDEPTDVDGSYRIPVEPIQGARVTAHPVSGAASQTGDMGGMHGVDVDFGNDVFVAVGPHGIARRTLTNPAWTVVETGPAAHEGMYSFLRIKYGGGRWIALCTNDLGTDARAYVSIDDGQTWTYHIINTTASYLAVYGLAYFGTNTWLAVGRAMWVSSDGGENWVVRDGNESETWEIYDAAVISPGEVMAPVYNDFDAPATARMHISWSNNYGVGWGTNVMRAWAALAQDPWKLRHWAIRALAIEGDAQLYIHANGQVSSGTRRPENVVVPSGDGYIISDEPSLPGSSGGRVYDAVYHGTTHVTVVVGSGSDSLPRVWVRGNAPNSTWERQADVEAFFADNGDTAVYSAAFDADGNILYLGSTSFMYTGIDAGLRGGNYNVYVVSYFNTHAGRFAFDFSKTLVSTEDGGRIKFDIPLKTDIVQANAWMQLVPGTRYSRIVDDLRFDVYIQTVGEAILGEDVAYTIRYAFTSPYNDGTSADKNRTIDELPLGRQLLTDGLPTTAVFEKSLTALHQGRVWGMANQDESLWEAQGDGISLEIANQANRFVLTYTEIGWANLMSDRSFIPLQPTQSSTFTGILSTPSGLLVMFENEIFLVTGDPAFGNVTVELYLDMVGCDVGVRPAKVGGLPFTIWNGKLWALQAGQAQQIGAEQWLADDPFVRVAPEPQSRSILALTRNGQVFRYMLDDAFWFTDAVNADGSAVLEMLPSCTCVSGDNTRFVLSDPLGDVYATRRDGRAETPPDDTPPDAPHVVYRDLDFGSPERRNSLYLVKVGLEGDILQAEYDRDDAGFDAAAVPVLYFSAANTNNGATYATIAESGTGVLPVRRRSGNRRSGTVHWRLPLRRTRGSSIDVRLQLNGFGFDDVMKFPLRFFVASGGEAR